MDRQAILALYDEEQRIGIEFPGTRKERRPNVIRYVSEQEGQHFILYSRLAGADVEAVIAEEEAYFGPLGGVVEWKVYEHDEPADLRERLGARGWAVEAPDAIMVLDLRGDATDGQPGRGGAPEAGMELLETAHRAVSTGEGVEVRRLESAAALEDVARIEAAVWEEDFGWVVERLGADLALPGYLSVYAAYVAGQPACAGWTYFHANSQFASLWGGSTVPEHRGKGLYTAVLAARVAEAAQRGYRFLTIDASPMSQPIAAKHGFRVLTRAWACKWGR
jgi:hypothetical protein